VPILLMSNKIISSVRHGTSGSQVNIHVFRMNKPTLSECDSVLHQKLCQTLHRIALPSSAKQPLSTNKRVQSTPKPITPSITKANPKPSMFHDVRLNPLIALGASTGGTEALSRVLSKLSTPSSAVVIVQHIPASFGAPFVLKLDSGSPMKVVEAHDGDVLLQGHVYMGVGAEHFFIERDGNHLIARVKGNIRTSGHCPSVNVLFDSVAKHVGGKAVGGLLTGMGEDGATGLKKMRDARARTLAQDEKTSVVWGMPGAAVKLNAAEEQVALDDVARRLMQLAVNGVK
ncbi:MAG: CheB methylesterase domain-containing protein, partial [Mariprofundaceae bacterium]|nr:CheB methylesterase domain-containing protein [Mariprofundaceae bacterium]